ncbi:hypothetical protein BD626DRAFT_569218 [Schizophyllum amplum]|uniref:ATPase inhibitor, mitochondrial n=1 Tax=Schizophyllum amplum TaxID=97359 RepID=A0A550CEE8_9AGAR|nr:hypothetical protein BD626DRAFT_569218 [Auriculariopsis ampla]
MLTATRLTAARRAAPQLTTVAKRYASSVKDGSVASSKEFSKREKAQEDSYARQHEQELIKKMRDEIEKKRKELDVLEKQHADELSKAEKK